MPRSQKNENKGAKEKKQNKNSLSKDYGFQTEVVLINQGKVIKGTSLSKEDIEKYSSPKTKKQEKQRKPFDARVYANKIEFKDKIVLGNRNKRLLEYENIKLLEQLHPDGRIVFVSYVMPKNEYFLVLEFSNTNFLAKFLNMTKENNPNVELRWANKTFSDNIREQATEDVAMAGEGEASSPKPGHEYDSNHNQEASFSISDSHQTKPWTTTSSYICADPHFDDGTVYSMRSSNTFISHKNKSGKHFRRRGSCGSLDLSDKHEPRWRADGSTTQYYYIGPSDEEDSVSKSVLRETITQKKPHGHKHHHYTFADEVSVSMTPSSFFSDLDYYSNDSFEAKKDVPFKKPSSRKPCRSKSRELPLSEAERNKGGWHSDVLFVTPTKDGGVKVSADGPVMLYTATRANGSRNSASSSDEDSTSDGDSDFSYSSGSTLTLRSPDRYHTRLGMEVDYSRGH